ncbi:major facilitator superfamily domain-containing protein [Lasiosphaeris hirsuta]|uniref:Major facilitator superfamily domain-containing protein n=1 Tax=Lasiosphaeris hirsuta TaxID=260670 RepID=A0AA40AFU0_9PEZI|nr:major facilitator superfamily domain-containing protein [Lasiosphaeris hirsuta]
MTDQAREESPLLASVNHLGNHDSGSDSDSDPGVGGRASETWALPATTRDIPPSKRFLVLLLCLALSVLLGVGDQLVSTPLLVLEEEIICRQVHGPDPVFSGDGNPCKDKHVQGELSFLTGWATFFALVPGVIMAVPYGAVADRYGRTPILGLSIMGVFLNLLFSSLICVLPDTFPLRLVWLSSAAFFVGGGPTVYMAMMYTIVADISNEAQKSTAFFFLGSVIQGSALLSNPITYFVMKKSAWFSITIGLILLALATVMAFFLPETLNQRAAVRTSSLAEESFAEAEADGQNSRARRLLVKAIAALKHTFHAAHWLFWEHKLLGLLLLSLTMEILGRCVTFIDSQYISNRYKMTFSEAGLVESVKIFFQLLLLTTILPLTSQLLLTKFKYTAREKDLRLTQASAVLAATGIVILALAETKLFMIIGIIISATGVGFTFMLRGLMTSLVGGHEVGLLFTSIALVETAAALVSGPSYAKLYKIGLYLGPEWIGLPYLVAGVVLILAAVLVGIIRVSGVADHHDKRPQSREGFEGPREVEHSE